MLLLFSAETIIFEVLMQFAFDTSFSFCASQAAEEFSPKSHTCVANFLAKEFGRIEHKNNPSTLI